MQDSKSDGADLENGVGVGDKPIRWKQMPRKRMYSDDIYLTVERAIPHCKDKHVYRQLLESVTTDVSGGVTEGVASGVITSGTTLGATPICQTWLPAITLCNQHKIGAEALIANLFVIKIFARPRTMPLHQELRCAVTHMCAKIHTSVLRYKNKYKMKNYRKESLT
ncbi:hypothetical protein DH2020_034540 [Rehmannia glutinosa]|uniref:Uncharacterized protein n=1 Tax=Rehmannia glutinosa TaxID=99300 RepID=A0ABR0V9U7_REHGL